jgi:hypothetical protein
VLERHRVRHHLVVHLGGVVVVHQGEQEAASKHGEASREPRRASTAWRAGAASVKQEPRRAGAAAARRAEETERRELIPRGTREENEVRRNYSRGSSVHNSFACRRTTSFLQSTSRPGRLYLTYRRELDFFKLSWVAMPPTLVLLTNAIGLILHFLGKEGFIN